MEAAVCGLALSASPLWGFKTTTLVAAFCSENQNRRGRPSRKSVVTRVGYVLLEVFFLAERIEVA